MKLREVRQREAWQLLAWIGMAVAALLIVYGLVEEAPVSGIVGLGPVIGASLGAGVTYMLTRRQRRQEDDQRRRALATLLLSELQSLEQTLTDIRGRADPGGNITIAPFQTAVYDSAGSNLLLFTPDTVHALLCFYQQVHALRETLMDLVVLVRTTGHPFPAGDIGVHWKVRWRAASAAQAIMDVAQRLSAEGGEWPRALPLMPMNSLDLPDLPPPVFEQSSR